MKRTICAIVILFLIFPSTAFPQQSAWTFDPEDEAVSVFRLTDEIRRQYVYYDDLQKRRDGDIMLRAAVSDPYFNSSDSFGQGYDDLWGLKRIDIERAWSMSKGEGVLVAVLDSGIDFNHPDIDGNIWVNLKELNGAPGVDDDNNGFIDDIRGWDFVGSDCDAPIEGNSAMDYNGHGTFVAGIIGAEENASGIIGVAPEAKILPVKVLDDSGFGMLETLASGIRYAANMGAQVINMSLAAASGFMPLLLREAIDYAYSLGCVLVGGAGNDSADVNGYVPANYYKMLTVTAMDEDGNIASFSNFGNDVDIASPGVGILSLRADGTDMYDGSIGYAPGDNYIPMDDEGALYYWASGTSMSAAYVSGLAALIFSHEPTISNDEVMNKIRFSAADLGAPGFDRYFGYGALDAYEALTTDCDNIFDILDYCRAELNDVSSSYKSPAMITTRAEVTGIKNIRGVDTLITWSLDGDVEGAQYVTSDTDGMKIYGILVDLDKDGKPDEIIFDSPLDVMPQYVEAGKTYNDSAACSYGPYNFLISSSVTIHGLEDITLDSGIFVKDALKISMTLSMDNTDGYGWHTSQTVTNWSMKDVGDVKTVTVNPEGETETSNIRTSTGHYESGRVKSRLLESPDPDFMYYEYLDEDFSGELGRISKKQKIDGSYCELRYWGEASVIKVRESYDPCGALLDSEELYEDGSTVKSRRISDQDGVLNGTVVAQEYDDLGRLIRETYDNGKHMEKQYFGITSLIMKYSLYRSNGELIFEIEYCEDGGTIVSMLISSNGTLTIGESGTLTVTDDDGSITAIDGVSLCGSGGYTVNNGILVVNEGALIINSGTLITNDGGSGSITINNDIGFTNIGNDAGGSITINNDTGWALNGGIGSGGTITMTAESVTGAGTIYASFGSEGLWRYSFDQWTMLSASGVESFMLSDKHDYRYDVIGDFGRDGIWKYSANQWSNLTMADSESFLLSSLTNGGYDVIGDFGSGGLWKYSGSTWEMLTAENAKSFALSLPYGDCYDVIGDFGSGGFWKYSGSTWTMLSGSTAESYITTDICGDGYDIIGDFGQGGLWRYSNADWAMLTADNVEKYILSDRHEGDYDIIGDFGSGGLWRYSGSDWRMLTVADAESFTLSDMYNGAYDVIGDFGSGGLWRYSDANWSMLTAEDATSFALSESIDGCYDIIGDFGSGGLWKYSDSAWSILTAESAESFSLSYSGSAENSYELVADFGDKGMWKHSDNSWTELTTAMPIPEISQKMDVLNSIGTPGQVAPQGYTFTRSMAGGPAKRRLGAAVWK